MFKGYNIMFEWWQVTDLFILVITYVIVISVCMSVLFLISFSARGDNFVIPCSLARAEDEVDHS